MTTVIHKLDSNGEDAELLKALCRGTYLDGECYAFATALHEGLGWPIIGLMDGDVIRHAAVLSPDGKLHDVRGFISNEEFGRPFGFSEPYITREITIAELSRENEPEELRERSVRMARKMAEALWPELPWKDSLAIRLSAFADALEKISREHGFWIRASVPADSPIVAVAFGDEKGYDLRPTVDGLTYTIDRRVSL